MNLRELVLDNKKKQHLYRKLFNDTFNARLDDFMDLFMGFDIVKFDEFIGTPDGQSLSDFLNEKFGAEAQALVRSLI